MKRGSEMKRTSPVTKELIPCKFFPTSYRTFWAVQGRLFEEDEINGWRQQNEKALIPRRPSVAPVLHMSWVT